MSSEQEEHRTIYLKSSGKLFDKNSHLGECGLLTTIYNHRVKNKTWKIMCAVFSISGIFAIADERGQVFACSIKDNTYHAVRLASTLVASMCFVPSYNSSKSNQLIVAFESGAVALLDVMSKDIIGNLQTPSGSTVRIIRCHPTSQIAVMVSDDMSLTMWDLRFTIYGTMHDRYISYKIIPYANSFPLAH